MANLSKSRSTHSVPWMRRIVSYAIILIIGATLGFVPIWVKSRECSSNLAKAEHQLVLARMENSLAAAAIDARRGDYETTRLAASDFFTSLQTEVNRDGAPSLSLAQIEGLQSLLNRRDEVISLLARNDPAATDRLSDLYVAFRELMTN